MYEHFFSKDSLYVKLSQSKKLLPSGIVKAVTSLVILFNNKNTSKLNKSLIILALGYFICPFDFIPDITPIIGYLDDIIVIIHVMSEIKKNHLI